MNSAILASSALALLTTAALAASPSSAQVSGQSPAQSPARSTVTIQAQGTDLSGTLSSPRASCVNERTVIVIKVVGTRGGGDDQRFASDLASADGTWSTGNTGVSGRFFAKVKATSACRGDTSPTIRAHR